MIRQSNKISVMGDEEVVGEVEDLSRLKGSDEEDRHNKQISEQSFGLEEMEVSSHLRGRRVMISNNDRGLFREVVGDC
jgi:hypothetical protein